MEFDAIIPPRCARAAAGSQRRRACAGPAAPRRRRASGSSIKAPNAPASAGGSSGGTRTPHDPSMISAAPPIRVLTTGRLAYRASMKAMPNGSGPVFGWQWTSAAASRRGTSERSPRNRTRSATPAARLGAEFLQVGPLVRPLRAPGDPGHPARSVAQAAQRRDQERLALPALHPAHLEDHHGLGRGRQLLADGGAGIRVGPVNAWRIHRVIDDLRGGTGEEPGERLRGALAVDQDEVGGHPRRPALDPVRTADPVVQPEDERQARPCAGGPNSRCGQQPWQTTTSKGRAARSRLSPRRARQTVHGWRNWTGPRRWTAALSSRSSAPSRPSKQSTNSGSIPGAARRCRARVLRNVSIPP